MNPGTSGREPSGAPRPSVAPAPTSFTATRPPSQGGAPAYMASAPAQPVAPARPPAPIPPEGRLACEGCGGTLVYDPTVQDLKCEYCGRVQHIPQSADDVRELPFEQMARLGDVAAQVLQGVAGEKRCKACGATVMVEAHVATDVCPFCASPLEKELEAAQAVMPPQGVLPFRIDEANARAAFTKWVGSLWFAPSALKRMAKLESVAGLYVPFWTYDAMTWSWYSGERGDAYWVTVGTGNNKRRERRVRWTPVSGRVDQFFDDTLVCASKSLPDKLVRSLGPWDLKQLLPLRPEYLKGFRTERYQIGAPEGYLDAKAQMDQAIAGLVRASIGGDEQRVHRVQTQVGNITFKHILLPLWLAAYRWKGEVHRILVNARTGEVQGTRPYSMAKITLAVLAGLIVLGALILLVMRNAQ